MRQVLPHLSFTITDLTSHFRLLSHSTEQPAAEVAAEEVKQVNEDEGTGDIVGHVPVQVCI